ncbi:unnamed protein product, partial [Callosobruchus maculatus]
QSKADIYGAYKTDKFLTQLLARNASYEFTNANKIYVSDGIPINECIINDFPEELERKNFKQDPENARLSINNWVETTTHQMIKDLLPAEFVSRSTESLRKYFDNKKRDIRKLKAEERKETLLTGGGPPRRPPDDPTQDLLLGIMDPLTVFGDENNFDSDNIEISKKVPTSNNVVPDDAILCYEFKNTEDDNDILNNNSMVSVIHVDKMTDEVNDENKNLEPYLRGNNELNDSAELGQTDRNWKKQTIPNLKNKISNVLKRPLESNLLTQAQGSKKKFDTSRRRPTSTVVELSLQMT